MKSDKIRLYLFLLLLPLAFIVTNNVPTVAAENDEKTKCEESGGTWKTGKFCCNELLERCGFGAVVCDCPTYEDLPESSYCDCPSPSCLEGDTCRPKDQVEKCQRTGGIWETRSLSCPPPFNAELCNPNVYGCPTPFEAKGSIFGCNCPDNKCFDGAKNYCVVKPDVCAEGTFTSSAASASNCFTESSLKAVCTRTGGQWKTISGLGIFPPLPAGTNAKSCLDSKFDVIYEKVLHETECPIGNVCDPAVEGRYCSCPSGKCVSPNAGSCSTIPSLCKPSGISTDPADCNKVACVDSGGTWKEGGKSVTYCDGSAVGISYAGVVYNCFCPSGSCLAKDGKCQVNANVNGNSNVNSNANANANANTNANTNTNTNTNTNDNFSPCRSITGEVTSSIADQESQGSGEICTEFTVKVKDYNNYVTSTQHGGLIEAGRDVRDLTKKEISADSKLLECKQRAQSLASAIKGGKFVSESLSPQIRESFSTISFKYASNIRYYNKKGHVDSAANEFYYYNDQYNYYDYLASNTFGNYTYGSSYSGNAICRIHFDEASQDVVGYEVRNRPTGSAGQTDWQTATQTLTRCVNTAARTDCDHRNVYNYNFTYQVNQNQNWLSACATTPHKCENIKLSFTPSAEWFASLNKIPVGSSKIPLFDDLISPPIDFCPSNTGDCIAAAKEYSLTSETWGKGSQKVPVNFVENTQKSLTSSNPNLKCSDGVCVAYTSGELPFTATAAASSYLGQCRGYGLTLNTPEEAIPQVVNNAKINIINRPPVVSLSMAKDNIALNEEVEAICDIVDPDECSDKIAKVTWKCFNFQGKQVGCFLGNSGSFSEGNYVQEIPLAERSNPYRAKAVFKATVAGGFAVTCEAADDDVNSAATSSPGIAGIAVGDGAVIAQAAKFCTVLLDNEENNSSTVCGNKGEFQYKAYALGIEPQTYNWKCDSSSSTSEESASPKKKCNYAAGTYLPSLSILGKDGRTYDCVTQITAQVTNESKCKVEVRKPGSGNEYSNQLEVAKGDEFEARLVRQCLSNGVIKWDGFSDTKDSITIKFDNSGTRTLGAKITKEDNSVVTCSPAEIIVKDKLQFGN